MIYLSFNIGNLGFALPSESVRKVLPYAEPKAIPLSKDWIKGVIPFQGVGLPVIDPADIPDFLDEKPIAEHNFIIVVEYGEYLNGFLASKVDISGNRELSSLDFDGQPVIPFNRRFVDGVITVGDNDYYLIDCSELHESIDIT